MNRSECKSAAREQLQKAGNAPKLITLVFLLTAAAVTALRLFLGWYEPGGRSGSQTLSDQMASGARNLALSFGISFLLQLVLVVLMAGYTAMALGIHKEREQDWRVLLTGFSSLGRVILLDILKALRLVLWSYVFCLPAAYLLTLGMVGDISMDQNLAAALLYGYVALVMFIVSYRYRLCYFLLMDHPELSATMALRRAASMTKGHRWELFRMDLSFLPWLLLGTLTCGILLIWKLPYMAATYANVYEALSREEEQRLERMRELMEQQQNFPR